MLKIIDTKNGPRAERIVRGHRVRYAPPQHGPARARLQTEDQTIHVDSAAIAATWVAAGADAKKIRVNGQPYTPKAPD